MQKLQQGLYVIFEGSDGAGKTTVMNQVAKILNRRLLVEGIIDDKIILTHHPGSTPLGRHIRKLVKTPHIINDDINIDNLSRQMLYMVDTINFIKTLLEPAISSNKILFADRSSFISAMVYGLAEGLDLKDVEKLFDIITPPKADRVIVLQLPAEVGRKRALEKRGADLRDHFDQKPLEFFEKVAYSYDNLITESAEKTSLISRSASLKNIHFVDSTLLFREVVNIIVEDIYRLLLDKCVATV